MHVIFAQSYTTIMHSQRLMDWGYIRVRTGPWSAWKYLKFITVFSRPWNPWKTAVFWSKCLKVLEFPLDNKSYNLLQSSVKISVEEFYQIPQCTVFVAFPVLRCSVTISINKKTNGPGKILFGAGKSLKSPWFLCLVSCTNPDICDYTAI